MAFRLPGKHSADLWSKSPAGVLDYELAQETASALGRQGRALVERQHDQRTTARRLLHLMLGAGPPAGVGEAAPS